MEMPTDITDIKEPGERLTLHKNARLRLRSLIDPLYMPGASKATVFPLRANFRALSQSQLSAAFRGPEPEGIGRLQVMLVVPKRKLHHAVDRVAMRRRMREAWRLERAPLLRWIDSRPEEQKVRTLSVSLLYLANARKDMARIRERMRELVADIIKKLDAVSSAENNEA